MKNDVFLFFKYMFIKILKKVNVRR